MTRRARYGFQLRACGCSPKGMFERSCIMKKWILAGIVVVAAGLLVDAIGAQERVGLLQRLRGRNGNNVSTLTPMATTTTSSATTTAPITQEPSGIVQAQALVPVPTTPTTQAPTTTLASTAITMQVTEGRRGILGRRRSTSTVNVVPTTSSTPTTTTQPVEQVQSTQPVTTTNTTPVNESRPGLLGRLRMRR